MNQFLYYSSFDVLKGQFKRFGGHSGGVRRRMFCPDGVIGQIFTRSQHLSPLLVRGLHRLFSD